MAPQPLNPWREDGRPRWGCIATAAVAVVLVAGGIYIWYHRDGRNQVDAAVNASAGRLTFEKDDGGNLAVIGRKGQPEVWYRVTLEDAPIGRELALTCEWVDPSGRVIHRNRYKTKEITRTPWPTHARYRLGPEAPLGTWRVRLLLDGRELRTLTFKVGE
jgi:hypothetical protein